MTKKVLLLKLNTVWNNFYFIYSTNYYYLLPNGLFVVWLLIPTPKLVDDAPKLKPPAIVKLLITGITVTILYYSNLFICVR